MFIGWKRNASWAANKCAGANFQGKDDASISNAYSRMKLIKHAMEIIARVLERRIRVLVNVDAIQFGIMSGRETTNTSFVVRRM